MTTKKRFLLRVDPKVYAAVEKWAADDLRSVNAQMEFLLKRALDQSGRLRRDAGPDPEPASESVPEPEPDPEPDRGGDADPGADADPDPGADPDTDADPGAAG